MSSLFAIFGYSINDTVIIFDRIRDISRLNDNTDFKLIVNESVNKTLSRTIMTSASTLLVTLSLMFFQEMRYFIFFFNFIFWYNSWNLFIIIYIFFPLFLFDDSKIRFTRIERKVWTPRS